MIYFYKLSLVLMFTPGLALGEVIDLEPSPMRGRHLDTMRDLPRAPIRPLRPDLIVTDVTNPVYNGSTYMVRVSVKNNGGITAPSSYLLLYESTAGGSNGVQIPAVTKGQTITVQLAIYPTDPQMPYRLSAIADYGNHVSESIETNNSRTISGYW